VSYSHYVVLFFFFFQAEDGIRDLTVTGVQTCALPISASPSFADPSPLPSARIGVAVTSRPRTVGFVNIATPRPHLFALRKWCPRSEERRVGKECRSRGWAYD